MKFDFIATEKAHFPVEFMCRMLEVSTSGYYASRKRPVCKRRQEDRQLAELIQAEFAKHRRGCGSRMVLGGLREQGYNVSRKRVVRLMAEKRLRCRLKRRFARTTDSNHTNNIAPNIVDGSNWDCKFDEAGLAETVAKLPLKRAGKPEDYAEVIFYLLAGAGYITGQTIVVDGGGAR